MLQELHITNLAVIEDTTLSFNSNYVALVGETGAGKSLIVFSLNLLLGQRVDFSLIRDKEKKAIISATFCLSDDFLDNNPELKDYVEGNILIIKRVLLSDHNSRCYINDEPVSNQALKRLSEHLIDIHSQNSNSDLLDENKQLFYLDGFLSAAGIKAKNDFLKEYDKLKETKAEYEEFVVNNKEIDRDYLEFQIEEIEKYHLKENEIEDLNKEFDSLKEYASLEKWYQEYQRSLNNGSISFEDMIYGIETSLRPFKASSLCDSANRLESSLMELNDALNCFKEDFEGLDFNPRRIDEINERLFSLKGLMRKYGKTTKEILGRYQEYKDKLNLSDCFEDEKVKKESLINELEKSCLDKAETLQKYRLEASTKMTKEINKEMVDLGLRKNGFSIEFTKTDLNKNGLYSCVFYAQMNDGIAKETLAKACSGGETSRMMLVLKIVLNRLNPYDLMVFDEIDTGVSGKQASLIAKKILSLSKESEILVISHLPQVVASSNSAIYIKKINKNGTTMTEAMPLKDEKLVLEIAKMLSGDNITEAAKNQAIELIKEYRE